MDSFCNKIWCRNSDIDYRFIENLSQKNLGTISGVLHPKNDVDRLYLSREMGGQGLVIEWKKTTWNSMSGIQLSH